jgi:hypothetical protein
VCADDGAGKQLYAGLLSTRRTFRGRRVRLNVGLGPSTRITVNGRPLTLATSPAGVDLTRTTRRPLALGSRPSC